MRRRATSNAPARLTRRGDLGGGRSLLRQAIAARHPLWSRWAAHHLVNIELRDGDGVTAALAVLEPLEAWHDEPASAVELWLRGRFRYLHDDVDGAIEFYRAAVQRAPQVFADVSARVLAEIYLGRGDYRTAARFARSAVRLYEADDERGGAARAQVLVGECFLERNRWPAAARSYRRALRYAPVPEVAPAWFRLASMDLARAEPMLAPGQQRKLAARALAMLDEVEETRIRQWVRVEVRLARARAHELLGDHASAQAELEAAERLRREI